MVYNKLERSKGGAKMLFTNKKTDIATNRFGGDGDVIINHYIDEKLINDSIVMYAEVVLKPGCNLGYHQHSGNSETDIHCRAAADGNFRKELFFLFHRLQSGNTP